MLCCVAGMCFIVDYMLSLCVCHCSERLKEEARLEEERERKEEIERYFNVLVAPKSVYVQQFVK